MGSVGNLLLFPALKEFTSVSSTERILKTPLRMEKVMI